jgi:hypothetical protein
MQCLNDCWVCNKKNTCKIKNNFCVVFAIYGKDCKMQNVCNPQMKYCPASINQLELFNE